MKKNILKVGTQDLVFPLCILDDFCLLYFIIDR
jgi:hypothetical protein